MVSVENLKRRVTAIIDRYGKTCQVLTTGAETKDAYGRITYAETSTDIKAVFDKQLTSRMRIFTGAKISEAQTEVILDGNAVIDKSDIIVVDSVRYRVMELEKYDPSGIVVANRLLVTEE